MSGRYLRARYLGAVCVILGTVNWGCESERVPETVEVVDECPDNPNKTSPGICGCDTDDVINAVTGIYACMHDVIDFCPNDPNKTEPGICGCGVADTRGKDGLPLCQTQNIDLCPDDPNKTLPGICGCGIPDSVSASTGIPACLDDSFDLCPGDPNKTLPGVCGCGEEDIPDPVTGIPTCLIHSLDLCPGDPNKTLPGVCGCGIPDVDSDGDTVLDCNDLCPADPNKTDPGTCGCGSPDSLQSLADTDRDGVPNCLDACPENFYKSQDDGCDCDARLSTYGNRSLCARMITSAEEFVALRDRWNRGLYAGISESAAFILADDINLGEVLSQEDAKNWVGIGTETYPFDGIFFGDQHEISATVRVGYAESALALGDPERSNVALFGYTSNAVIDGLHLQLIVQGAENIAALIANATKTAVSRIRIDAQVTASGSAALLAGRTVQAVVESVLAKGEVKVSGDMAACIAAQASGTSLRHIDAACGVSGGNYVAGTVARASNASRLIDIYASGSVLGAQYTGGIVGVLEGHSSLLNAYTTAPVTCAGAPCATAVAHISDYVSVKNVYTTGQIIDKIEKNDVSETISLPEGESGDSGAEQGQGGLLPPSADIVQIPSAMLIASLGTPDNLASALFYWRDPGVPAFPDISRMTGMADPVGFSYRELRPYTDDGVYLLTALNDALLCNSGVCSIDGNACLQWTAGLFAVTMPDSLATMSVTIPKLHITF